MGKIVGCSKRQNAQAAAGRQAAFVGRSKNFVDRPVAAAGDDATDFASGRVSDRFGRQSRGIARFPRHANFHAMTALAHRVHGRSHTWITCGLAVQYYEDTTHRRALGSSTLRFPALFAASRFRGCTNSETPSHFLLRGSGRGIVAGETSALKEVVGGIANVRFGSKADIHPPSADVRFTPKSGHWNSVAECPLYVKSGLMQCSKISRYSIASSAIERTPGGTSMPSARALPAALPLFATGLGAALGLLGWCGKRTRGARLA